ncbi:MAG: chorismate mutase [Alphaproteobacteria bacterium]|nr:chorismate mutase [Alphaproteobacteria bacterium]
MNAPGQSLDDLRREIDRIDDSMHDLVMRRAELAERVRRAKGDGPSFRPAREAQLLRRLLGRHQGSLPIGVVARIWREMVVATLRLQENFTIAVAARADQPGLWDLARDHYGSTGAMHELATGAQVVRAVAEGEALIGVLPMPREDDVDPWWPALTAAAGGKGQPHVIARLPFVAAGNARGERPEALAIARLKPEASGEDRSLLVIETTSQISRARLVDVLRQAGLDPGLHVSAALQGDADARLSLVEVGRFVADNDAVLKALGEAAPSVIEGGAIARTVVIGAYAVPIALT